MEAHPDYSFGGRLDLLLRHLTVYSTSRGVASVDPDLFRLFVCAHVPSPVLLFNLLLLLRPFGMPYNPRSPIRGIRPVLLLP